MNCKGVFKFRAFIFLIFFSGYAYPQQPVNLTVKLYLEGLYLGGGILSAPLYNAGQSTNPLDADSLILSLAASNPPYAIVYSTKILLLTNGTASAVLPGAVDGQSYFIVVKNRNSIETWSKQPVTFGADTYYNFTSLNQFSQVTTATFSNIDVAPNALERC